MCDKPGYSSKQQARQASKQMRNTFRVYQCAECGWKWHTTHR